MLSGADATDGWTFQSNGTLTKRKFRRDLAIWKDGNYFHFQVDVPDRVLKMGRRSTLAAAKKAADNAARPAPPA